MNSDRLQVKNLEISRLEINPRLISLFSALGAIVALAAIAISAYEGYSIKQENVERESQLRKTQAELENATKQLNELQMQINNTRESFAIAQLGLNKFLRFDYAGAIKYYEQAIKIDPNNPVLYDFMGYAFLRSNKPSEAVSSLEKSVAINPRYTLGHYNLALAYWASGDHSRAINEVKLLLEIDPSFKSVIKGDGQFSKFKVSSEFLRLLR